MTLMGASAAFERFDNFLSRLNILFERKDAEVDAALFVRVLFAGAEQFIAARFDFGYLFINRVELRGKFIYLLLRLSLNFFELCGALCGATLLRFEVIERRLGSLNFVVYHAQFALAADFFFLRFLELRRHAVVFRLRRRDFARELFVSLLPLGEVFFKLRDGLFELFDIIAAAEYARVLPARTARHRAARIHDLTVERDDFESVAEAL